MQPIFIYFFYPLLQRLPRQIEERNEKLKEEMMGKMFFLGFFFLGILILTIFTIEKASVFSVCFFYLLGGRDLFVVCYFPLALFI